MGENRVEELIGRKKNGQVHGQIVFRKRGRKSRVAGRIAAEGKNAEGAAELRMAGRGGFLSREGAEFPGTALDDAAWNLVCESGSLCAGTRGIREDVQIGEGARGDEFQGGGVIGSGFAGEAGDEVRADGGMRQ